MSAGSWRLRDPRDDRAAAKAPPATDEHAKVAAKKDTKRWCRGKEGRQHVARCMYYKTSDRTKESNIFKNWRELVCTNCGKVLATYMPWAGQETGVRQTVKPPWVIF